MFNVSFDISEVINEFSLQPDESKSLSNYILDRVTDEFVSKWENIVSTSLHDTKSEYLKAIYTDRPDDNTSIIGLAGRESKLAMMIETGQSAFDEKEGFANSYKKHIKKNGGWFLTIPFRHGTSEAIMEELIPHTNTTVLDFMKQGNTLSSKNLPAQYDVKDIHSLTLNTGTVIRYQHKAPIHEGMHRRDISSTDKEKRGGYFTFRRVSDKSDEQSWYHPGFEPHEFMERALSEAQIENIVGIAGQEWLDTKLGN